MTSKLTREELRERAKENISNLRLASKQRAFESMRKEILADLLLAEYALEAMESEPYGFTESERHGMVLEPRKWPTMEVKEPPLHIKEQPAPVVPDDVLDALQKVARIRLDLNDFDGDRRGIADCLGDAEEALIEVVNRRAAMLNGGKS
ncbi:TPA: hypothetical protein ACHOYU_004185 [Raoultella planticola]|uniref:hypothetical protein n=1 Tax=Raoultella ornithinolytica TaxID=54291 RepID=UPI002FEFE8FA